MVKKQKGKNKKCQAYQYSAMDIEEIKKRAYFIWESKGKPADSYMEDWFEAERELKDEGLI